MIHSQITYLKFKLILKYYIQISNKCLGPELIQYQTTKLYWSVAALSGPRIITPRVQKEHAPHDPLTPHKLVC